MAASSSLSAPGAGGGQPAPSIEFPNFQTLEWKIMQPPGPQGADADLWRSIESMESMELEGEGKLDTARRAFSNAISQAVSAEMGGGPPGTPGASGDPPAKRQKA